jgi:transcriptional regulator with XRE-family HTH domain
MNDQPLPSARLLAAWRIAQGYSLRAAGAAAGLSGSYVARVERGMHRPSPADVTALLDAYTQGLPDAAAHAVRAATATADVSPASSVARHLIAVLPYCPGTDVHAVARRHWERSLGVRFPEDLPHDVAAALLHAWITLTVAEGPPAAVRALYLAARSDERARGYAAAVLAQMEAARPLPDAPVESLADTVHRLVGRLSPAWQRMVLDWVQDLAHMPGVSSD